MLSCEFGEISKNTFFTEQVWANASQHDFNKWLLPTKILFNRYLNHGCLVYMFSLRFLGSKFFWSNLLFIPRNIIISRVQSVTFKTFRPAALLKKRPWYRYCFPVNFAKFLRTPFLQNTSGRLLLVFAKTVHGFQLFSQKASS